MAIGGLISRDELLSSGLGGDQRRARTALSLIKTRAARFSINRRAVNAPYQTENALELGASAYLSAISEGAGPPPNVTIYDIERSADAWRVLVPEGVGIRAWMIRLLGEEYRFKHHNIPAISTAFGLESNELQQTFQGQFDAELTTVFDGRLDPSAALRWRWTGLTAALEALPPFWTAFALTLTEIVGAGTLALPIAFATVGPMAGAAVLLVIGFLNVLTVSYLAEASARNGSILYGSAFIGKLVGDFLGPWAVLVVRLCLFAFCCSVLIAYYTGFSNTLASITGASALIWVLVLFGVGVFMILRRSLLSTVSSALVIGFVNIVILIALSLIALAHFDPANFFHAEVPLLSGKPFDPSVVQMIFGVVMTAYFGHVSVSNCAQAVLRREPDGRSLKTGTAAAMVASIVIYAIWAVSLGSAIPPARLASESGTALVPLAEIGGTSVQILGAIFVILALGMASVHFSLGIFNLARELVSTRLASTDTGSRTRHRLINAAALLPLLAIVFYVQWAFVTGNASFTKPLELQGAILTPILASVFPVLLIVAGRKRGRAVGQAALPNALVHPLILSVIFLIAIASLVLHATIIWTDPIPRALAVVAILVILVTLFQTVIRKSFSRGMIVELTEQSGTGAIEVNVSVGGAKIESSITAQADDGQPTLLPIAHSIHISLPEPSGDLTSIQFLALRVADDFVARPISGRYELLSSAGEIIASLDHSIIGILPQMAEISSIEIRYETEGSHGQG